MNPQSVTELRAFAIWWKDLDRWSPQSVRVSSWHWPPSVIKPLISALDRRCELVDKKTFTLKPDHFLSLRFTGEVEIRNLHGKEDFKGTLFFAHAGDIIYSKIDVRNGAIGIVPSDVPLATVTSEFPVYRIKKDVALAEYIRLVFRSNHFRRIINAMVSGASGRKRVQPESLENVKIPLPPLPTQAAIVARWRKSEEQRDSARGQLQSVVQSLNQRMWECYRSTSPVDVLAQRCFPVSWQYLEQWDGKSARAVAYRLACPHFIPLSTFAAEATELVRPWEEPDHQWPVFGVDNVTGVFFNQHQQGGDFNAPYKRIKRDWFFHNPTRANVGSLGIVPEVPEDAITSPEYQVWRITDDTPPGYVATLINTSFFLRLVDIHRVGAVKQRLYVENLLRIVVPAQPAAFMTDIAERRAKALDAIDQARREALKSDMEIEALILGTKTVNGK